MLRRLLNNGAKWVTKSPMKLAVGDIIKKRHVPMPKKPEILEEYGHLNTNANKIFKITQSNIVESMDYGGTYYHTGTMTGEELDDNLEIKRDGAVEKFPAGDFPLSTTEVFIADEDSYMSEDSAKNMRKTLTRMKLDEDEIARRMEDYNKPVHRKGDTITYIGCMPYDVLDLNDFK